MVRCSALLLAAGGALWAQVAGPDWVRETAAAPWQARDSQGEVAFGGRIWIFGGWFDSFHAPPRDVWSSRNGKEWKLVTKDAPWLHSDLPMSVTFRGRMWMMGGWYNGRLPGHSASNAVWSSKDGQRWEQVTASASKSSPAKRSLGRGDDGGECCNATRAATGPLRARWSPRIAGALVEFKGRLWMLGGTENYYFGDQRSLKNDVWHSRDGREWTLATEHAGWAPRAYHQAVVHEGRIWVFGGGNYVPEYEGFNDVWSSEDGVHWTQATAAAPWSPRIWFSAAEYRGHMWVLGGWSKIPEQNWGDVWFSRDGASWTRLDSKVTWKERHEHSAWVFRDKLWIAGGHAKPLSNEVWSLRLPRGFGR